jgi:crossover junction endodeoxyribonuclease RuvC
LRVVGIDPGLNITGYGIVEGEGNSFSLVEAGFVSTNKDDPMSERVRSIYDDVRSVIEEADADCVAIEELYSHYAHPRTAILMGHARGGIMVAAAKCGLPVTSYSATMIKKSLTGNGHASKAQVQRMIEVMLGLDAPPEPADVADALAVGLCHLNSAAKPIELGRRSK